MNSSTTKQPRFVYPVFTVAVCLLASCAMASQRAVGTAPCDTTGVISIPMRPIIFASGGLDRIEGLYRHPKYPALVTDAAEWRAIWHDWRPASPVPAFAFQDSVILLATLGRESGPISLGFVRVVCSQGVLVGTVQARRTRQQYDMPERAMAAVAISRSLVGSAHIRIDTLPDYWAP